MFTQRHSESAWRDGGCDPPHPPPPPALLDTVYAERIILCDSRILINSIWTQFTVKTQQLTPQKKTLSANRIPRFVPAKKNQGPLLNACQPHPSASLWSFRTNHRLRAESKQPEPFKTVGGKSAPPSQETNRMWHVQVYFHPRCLIAINCQMWRNGSEARPVSLNPQNDNYFRQALSGPVTQPPQR